MMYLVAGDVACEVAYREDAQEPPVVATHVEYNLEGGPEADTLLNPVPYALLLIMGVMEDVFASKYGFLIADG